MFGIWDKKKIGITIMVIDQDGERSSTESFEKMSLSEIKAALAESLPTAHIWYDQEGFIAVIMLYGETIREEYDGREKIQQKDGLCRGEGNPAEVSHLRM